MVFQRTQSNIPSLVCALLAAVTTGGTVYSFGFYGESLKKNLMLSQEELDTISCSLFITGIFSWIPGLIVDKYGPKVALSLGGTSGATFTMAFWAIARKFTSLQRTSMVPALSTLAVATFLSCALIVGSVFKILILSCDRQSKGKAVGIGKAYLGLGTGIYVGIFGGIPHTDTLDYLPMTSFFFITCVTIPALLLIPSKIDAVQFRDESTSSHFRVLYVALFLEILLVINASLVDLKGQEEDGRINFLSPVLILSLWVAPILLLQRLPKRTPDPETDLLLPKHCPKKAVCLDDGPDLNIIEMLQTPSAFLLLWTTTILVGNGLVETTNMGQMANSLHFPSDVTPACLALFSVSQAVARVVTGAFSEAFLDRLPRPALLAVACSVAALSHFILSVTTQVNLFVAGVVLSGIAFGMVWPLMVLIVGDLFGKAHFSSNYMLFDGGTCAMASCLFNKIVAERVYTHYLPHGYNCYGIECFQITHLVLATLALSGIVTSVVLVYTSGHIYKASA